MLNSLLIIALIGGSVYGGIAKLPNIDICEFPCTLEASQLICTVENGTYNLYESECMLKKHLCITGNNKFMRAPVSECLVRLPADSEICDFECPTALSPFCGQNGDNLRIFPNECYMRLEACKTQIVWQENPLPTCLQRTSNAIECPRICPLNYQPICGYNAENFTVFANQCEMDITNCRIQNHWDIVPMTLCDINLRTNLNVGQTEKQDDAKPESEEDTENCQRVCTKMFAPVCASNGENLQIFSNECVLKHISCQTKQIWKKLTFSECLFKV